MREENRIPFYSLGKQLKDFDERKKNPSVECEICGNFFNPKLLELYKVNDKELLLCEGCGKKLSDETSESKSELEDDEAIKILKLRYAKGEITKEEYEEIRKDLKE